ncbi:hypothetical protein [Arcanobacterium urinimassiliense]|uniref:hypothetical protein n=1 Tax=Arcanobacterium urinimassiliense TaxID=1871014 RepID=UPI00093B37B5|nr:hypothetical protein [Arcanobacterium urinimassiliense]
MSKLIELPHSLKPLGDVPELKVEQGDDYIMHPYMVTLEAIDRELFNFEDGMKNGNKEFTFSEAKIQELCEKTIRIKCISCGKIIATAGRYRIPKTDRSIWAIDSTLIIGEDGKQHLEREALTNTAECAYCVQNMQYNDIDPIFFPRVDTGNYYAQASLDIAIMGTPRKAVTSRYVTNYLTGRIKCGDDKIFTPEEIAEALILGRHTIK